MVSPSGEDLTEARFIRFQDSVRYRVIPMKVVKEIYRVALYTISFITRSTDTESDRTDGP